MEYVEDEPSIDSHKSSPPLLPQYMHNGYVTHMQNGTLAMLLGFLIIFCDANYFQTLKERQVLS